MQDIIQKIIEIDKRAQKLTEEAQQARTEAEKSVHADVGKLRDEYLARARRRIEKTQATEKTFEQDALKEIEQKHAATAEALRAMYEKNRAQWVDQLCKKVIGG